MAKISNAVFESFTDLEEQEGKLAAMLDMFLLATTSELKLEEDTLRGYILSLTDIERELRQGMNDLLKTLAS